MNASFEFEGEGVHPRQLADKLSFYGALEIRRGIIWNNNPSRNLLLSLIDDKRRSLLTGSHEVVANSADKFDIFFAEDNMPFDIMKLQLRKIGKSYEVTDLLIQSKNYLLSSAGTYDALDQTVDFRGKFAVLDDAAVWCVRRWPQLTPLRNSKGRLVMDFESRGVVPNPTLSVGSKMDLSHNKSQQINESQK
jgi:hypothetical protein